MAPAAPNPSRQIVVLAVAFYVPMAGCLFFLRPPGGLRVRDWPALGWGLAAALALGLLSVALTRLVTHRTAWGAALHGEFHGVLGGLGSRAILAVALLSAVGEELLFRGVLHPRLGLWITAALFGLMHFPVRRRLLPWTAFALVLGLALGVLTDWAGTLWPAILVHFVINYLNLHHLAEPLERPPPPAAPGSA